MSIEDELRRMNETHDREKMQEEYEKNAKRTAGAIRNGIITGLTASWLSAAAKQEKAERGNYYVRRHYIEEAAVPQPVPEKSISETKAPTKEKSIQQPTKVVPILITKEPIKEESVPQPTKIKPIQGIKEHSQTTVTLKMVIFMILGISLIILSILFTAAIISIAVTSDPSILFMLIIFIPLLCLGIYLVIKVTRKERHQISD